MADVRRFIVGGDWATTDNIQKVYNPYNGEEVAEICLAGKTEVDSAILKNYMSYSQTRVLSTYKKSKMLIDIGNRILRRKSEFIKTMVAESGKTLKEAKEELATAIKIFRSAGDVLTNDVGKTYTADSIRTGEGVVAFSNRFPIGIILVIGSFNDPILSLARKIAPAIAVGNPITIVPSADTPLTALLLGEILLETEFPASALSVLPADNDMLFRMVGNDQIRMINYTGHYKKGWKIKEASGRKKLLLQMSGVGVSVVNNDADLEYAADACVIGAFKNSGQLDSSLQRILVHEDVYYQFLGKFIKKANKLVVGNPANADTDIGPVINEDAAIRIENWIKDAVSEGADLITGGNRDGQLVNPTVFLDVSGEMLISREEVFGPVVSIGTFDDVEQAIWTVHDMEYGMQTSIFTNDLRLAMKAYKNLDVGAILLNEVPTFRVETLPYGGVKNSSYGRESIIESMRQMSEEKLLIINMNEEIV